MLGGYLNQPTLNVWLGSLRIINQHFRLFSRVLISRVLTCISLWDISICLLFLCFIFVIVVCVWNTLLFWVLTPCINFVLLAVQTLYLLTICWPVLSFFSYWHRNVYFEKFRFQIDVCFYLKILVVSFMSEISNKSQVVRFQILTSLLVHRGRFLVIFSYLMTLLIVWVWAVKL